MTKVRYYPDAHRIEIKGHAGFARAGQDVVCAGISTLVSTLINAVTDDESYMTHLYLNDRDAEIRIECYPDEEHEEKLRAVFDTIMTGFETVKQTYPAYIEIIGGHYGQ